MVRDQVSANFAKLLEGKRGGGVYDLSHCESNNSDLCVYVYVCLCRARGVC